MDWYTKTVTDIIQELKTDPQSGLTSADAAEQHARLGANELKAKKKASLLKKILDQFKSFLVIILIIASVISMFVGETTDAIVIIAIVAVNALLGVLQEGKAEKAMDALQKMSAPNARVIRNGQSQVIPARQLVPGDLVLIEAGDILPADVRLVESFNLKIEEASLTGESVPSEKNALAALGRDIELGDRVNMGYSGTIVTYGRGRGLVTDIGMDTVMGKIAGKIQNIGQDETPLQRKLDQLGKWLGLLCLAISALVFLIGFLRHSGTLLEMLMVAISLAVAAIPEGLPAVVTIVLALGMKRMVSRNVIIRKLLAVETLGSVNVICSDKTGTLTQNEMTVVKAHCGCHVYSITGQGYDPAGTLVDAHGHNVILDDHPDLSMLLTMGALCNDASLNQNEQGQWTIMGDPTEAALVVAGCKGNAEKKAMQGRYPRLSEIPFDSDRKMMTTFHNMQDQLVSVTKGAPDIVLDRCTHYLDKEQILPLDHTKRSIIDRVNSEFAFEALRVLAFAYRIHPGIEGIYNPESKDIEKDMVFVGLMGMIDPARPEARDAIALCRSAGIIPMMITGDHRDTAVAIARDLDLMRDGDDVMTGAEIEQITDEELRIRVQTTRVYARVSPDHKVRIVSALRKNDNIAAMTGDGVNDAMALKQSDIGVAMGITGTDVAKGTADMVLTDDNFASIVSAVEEGRIIYANIRKFVFFLLSCNVGEILIIFLAIVFGLPVPLLPIQLLWLNLVTDSFPALALGNEKGEPDIMYQKPRSASDTVLDRGMMKGILVQSLALTVAVLGAYILALGWEHGADTGHVLARTIAFTTLIFAELIRAFSCRSERITLWKLGIFTNKTMVYAVLGSLALLLAAVYVPFLQPIFKTAVLDLRHWGIILGFALIPMLAGELYKVIKRVRKK